ncbi:MAG TPA: ABC transporter substrate-binding protein [Kiloniellales bacterium]|nr:ABC transporter substrate-binding protein [Kiloniellales bacterium]
MKRWTRYGLAAAALAATAGVTGLGVTGAAAAERLTLYCSPQIEWCQLMVEAFTKETGIEVAMTRKSSGETFAQIKAEASNPRGDIWWGGTGDPHLQAAEEGLTQEYRSPMMPELHQWAVNQAKAANYRTVGIYAGALGIGYNEEVLAEKGLPAPECWKDLAKPAYKGEVQIANPNSSGTAYTTLATLVQLFGEDEAFEFMKAMHKNVNQYTKSGSAPIKAAARGETTIGITFMHDMVTQVVSGFPIKIVSPCEGTGYEIGSMSIIAGARNLESAKKYYDFALRPEVQELAEEAKAYQVMSNKNAEPPPQAPKLSELKLIDYDFKKYGSSDERTRLLQKWDEEVHALPR